MVEELDDAFLPHRKRPRSQITAPVTVPVADPQLMSLVREAISGEHSDMCDLAMEAVGEYDDEAHDEAHVLGQKLQEALLTLRLFDVERNLMRHKKCVLDRQRLHIRQTESCETTASVCVNQRAPYVTVFSFLTGVLIATVYPFSQLGFF